MSAFHHFLKVFQLRSKRRRIAARQSSSGESLEVRSLLSGTGLMSGIADASGTSDAGSASTAGRLSGIQTRIINGTQTNAYSAVGMIGDVSSYKGSATLIAPQYVLTAAHCCNGVADGDGRFYLGDTVYSTSRVFVHPDYDGWLVGSDDGNDIAIYKLDRPVIGVAPTPVFRGTPVVGQTLTLVGFGAGGTGASGHNYDFGIKRVGTTRLDEVTDRLIRWEFDSENEANTAPGDSGGPAYLTVGGVLYVAGVTSGGDQENAGLGDSSFDTRVDAYLDWIDSIIGTTTPPVSVSIQATDAAAAEIVIGQAPNSGTFVISRSGSVSSPLTVSLTRGGTAASGVDFASLPTAVTIPAGSSTITIAVTVLDDQRWEQSETVVLNVATRAGYLVDSTNGSATVTIADNDPPVNDRFASRRTITGIQATVTGANVLATKETGEPNIEGVSGGKSVWWTWKAAASGTVTLSTAGSSFDTTLGVYRGRSVSGLTLVSANDDSDYASGEYTSRLTVTAVAGHTYQIAVDGYQGATGTISLSLEQSTTRSARQVKLSELSDSRDASLPAVGTSETLNSRSGVVGRRERSTGHNGGSNSESRRTGRAGAAHRNAVRSTRADEVRRSEGVASNASIDTVYSSNTLNLLDGGRCR